MRHIQTGPRDARIVIVGEAPGATEESTGIPFSGGSGYILDKMLARTGIRRGDCFLTNIAHVRPKDNKFEWFTKKENQHHFLYGVLRLREDLSEIRPNLIIALGAQPLRILTGKQGIDKWRGSVLPCTLVPGLKVIGTYHPAYILRVMDYKAVAEFDLARAQKEQYSQAITYPPRNIYTPSGIHFRDGIEWKFTPGHVPWQPLAQEMLNAEYLAVDIECWQTPEGGWKLSCVGFSDRPSRALVLPYDAPETRHMAKMMCESDVPKVLQNGTFDATVLRGADIRLNEFWWDTMLAHHCLYAESATGSDEMAAMGGKKRQAAIAKGLAFQTSIYTAEPFYKDDGKIWRETSDVQMFYRYNGLDACITREIRDVQHRELDAYGAWDAFDTEMSLVQPLMDATDRGIKIDLGVRDQLRADVSDKITRLQVALNLSAGLPVNVKSSKQVKDLLYGKLGLPAKTKRGTGRVTADKDAIVALAGRHQHPALHAILRIREQRDLLERYIQAPIDADGRMRCSFDITGTRSGRLSSRISIYGSGTNLQTIPADLRHMFCADPGYVLLYRDYSQAEARVVAYLARSTGLIELFEDPARDIHKENAARIFNKAVEDISKPERYLAKRIIHASNYGMAERRFAEVVNEDSHTTGISINHTDAKRLIEKYFAIYPEIRNVFWKSVEESLRRTRALSTPFGRKRTFYGRWDDKLLREAYSYIPQSTVGDLGNKAVVAVSKQIPNAQFLLAVHDSILIQCPIAEARSVAEQMGIAMDIRFDIHGHTVRIPTDCQVGLNWGAKTETNPDGLVDLDEWEG